ncbi:MAG: DNA recombination protein RmuC [Alphaproteobacteria bacterium]|nr:DNA recombination protein RmuC [Alphaproteobacteria bacterium]
MTILYQTHYIIAIIALLTISTITLSILNIKNKNKLKKTTNNYSLLEKEYILINQKLHLQDNMLNSLQNEKQQLSDSLRSAENSLSAIKASSFAKEEALQEKITYLEKIKEDLTLKFKDISTEVIKSQHEDFSKSQFNSLSQILNPFKEQLTAFKDEVNLARTESIKNKSSLDTQLSNLVNLNKTLSQDAQNLASALKGASKAQGNWGECQLSRILEISGLRKDQDYETQKTFTNDNKKIYRPDVIIHLPDNRDIIIDSKVSLNAYLDATNTDDTELSLKYLQKNLSDIKSHIDELSSKEYQKLLKDTSLNYVIMFIPVESAYIAALELDNHIYDYAYKKNVILATPLSLLPTLRTVENLWRIDSQNQNVQKIAELGGKIYDKLAGFIDDMKAIDRALTQASNAYGNAMTKLQGKGSALSHAEKMRLLGSKTNKTINLTLSDNDLLLENTTFLIQDGD